MKSLFYKAKEEGKDLIKCLMIYYSTPLSGSLQSPRQILQSRSARSDLPMSNAARQEPGLQSEQLGNVNKNENFLHITYILVKRSCIKMLQASDGTLPLLPPYGHS